MRKFTLLSLFLSFTLFVSAQKQTDIWYFGNSVGLDFALGTPSVIAGGMSGYAPSEGCAVMSDAAGSLLFYTDGVTVINKNHVTMANGTGLMGGISSTQAALIVPQPGSNGIYYIFTTDDFAGANGFRYSIVDMNLAAGVGSVTVKNALLFSSSTEKVTSVKDPFNNRYWVVGHEWGNNNFYAYELSSTGLSAPVISSVGTAHTGTLQNTYGQMKFNPCGNKLAVAIGYTDVWEYFDFNTNTGVVSNAMTFGFLAHVYGIEFSPDASKVYVSTYLPGRTLEQFDVSSNNQSIIAATQTSLSTTIDTYGMQLASDGKIYIVKSFSQYIGVVNSPNLPGPAANYQDMQLDVDPGFMGITAGLSTPGFVQSYFLPVGFTCPTPVSTGVNEIAVEKQSAIIYPNPSADGFNILVEGPSLIKVYSYTGELVETLKGTKTFTFGEHYAKGIYFVNVQNSGKTRSFKVIKK
jgi:hypothetical protein